MRKTLQAGIAIWAFICGPCAFSQNVVSSWFPNHPGDKWIYQIESRDGSTGGIAHPHIERWKSEESVVSATAIPEGILVTKREQADRLDAEAGESRYLLRQDCFYLLDGAEAKAFDGGNDLISFHGNPGQPEGSPAFCFPLKVGMAWMTNTAADMVRNGGNAKAVADYEWHVVGVSGQTYHLSRYVGSGLTDDIWFKKGLGIVQERSVHHGTYEETRIRLVRFEPAKSK